MSYEIIKVILLSMSPFLELRAGLPYALLSVRLPWYSALLISVSANFAIAPLLWIFYKHLLSYFLHFGFVARQHDKLVKKSMKKLKPVVDKYGKLGLAIFIGVPLPGSGVYTGAFGACLLEFNFRDYIWASLVGISIAGVAVLLAVLSGDSLVRRLFIGC